eukprot:CCRYP_018117-RA/>CCRYP_018117-RA protein AED:0.37 eAED:0.39 QI:0/0/0/1/0/0/2/0/232
MTLTYGPLMLSDRKGRKYYSYILVYLDDLLVVHHNPKRIMDKINSFFPLKPDSPARLRCISVLSLRGRLLRTALRPGHYPPPSMFNKLLRMSHSSRTISKDGFPCQRDNPFPCDYAPEEDVTPLLEPGVATYYMQLIGVLRWMSELGWIDICTKVSMLSSFAAMPREGHLEAALHVFSYLKSKSNSRLIFDPKEPDVGKSDFVECDWSDFYPGMEEALPPNAPTPLGKDVVL